MKKIIASAGAVALGAAGVQALDYAPGFGSTDMAQPWSVALTLRGFYDDNYLTAPDDHPAKRDSWGFTIRPSGSVALSSGLTDVGARYSFTAYYFDDRADDHWDYTHQFDGYLSHSFSHRFNLFVTESFVYTREPEIFDPFFGFPFRTQQDNIRNLGTITLNAQLTQLLTLVLGYSNSYYDYEQDAGDVQSIVNPLGVGSYSARLDRVEHLISANLQWQLLPQTVGVIGYQFGLVNFTSDEYLSGPTFWTPGAPLIPSDVRNSYNHYIFAGVDHVFNPDLMGSVRAGVQYADFYNDPAGYDQWAPYANLNVRYRYGLGSTIDVGFMQQYSRTDVRALNASSSVVYASVRHAFTPKLEGSVLGQFQYTEFDGQVPGLPNYSDLGQYHYVVGLNLAYSFNRHVSADIGYNFDMLEADSKIVFDRYDFTRNRVYFGVTAKY